MVPRMVLLLLLQIIGIITKLVKLPTTHVCRFHECASKLHVHVLLREFIHFLYLDIYSVLHTLCTCRYYSLNMYTSNIFSEKHVHDIIQVIRTSPSFTWHTIGPNTVVLQIYKLIFIYYVKHVPYCNSGSRPAVNIHFFINS